MGADGRRPPNPPSQRRPSVEKPLSSWERLLLRLVADTRIAPTGLADRGNRSRLHVQCGAYTGFMSAAASVLELFRSKGLRMTPQRRAIVAEIMDTKGHISATDIARRVQDRVPGVNPSTVYRTLETLEDLGVLSHAHRESGPEYHRRAESRHVHLTCSRCGADDELSLREARSLEQLVHRHHGFRPDLSHFAISGLCASCQRAERARN